MATYTAWQVPSANADFEKVEKPLVVPAPGKVRVKVHACGLCHSDCFAKLGIFPGSKFPIIAGHEVAGVVDAVGEGVSKWRLGDRVGLGWFGGACHECASCREGDLILCDEMPVTGIHYDGGYQKFVIASASALAALPDEISFIDAAPLLCAGVTVYNGLRRVRALPGSIVAVQGIGGLGHLAIQYANKMGFQVFVFSRGDSKKELALKLGAHKYFDTTKENFVAEVQALGGVKVLLATSTSPAAMGLVVPTLAKNGTFVILGAGSGKIEVDPLFMISGRRTILGFPSGQASDSEDALKFAALSGVRPMNEVFPFEKAPEAYERMMSQKALFRVVLDLEQ